MRINRNVLATEMPPLVDLARRAGELAAEGADVIRVDQGAVDIAPPAVFVDRVAEALTEPDIHRYAPDPGLPGLRSELARYGRERFGVEWDPDHEIVVTTGANQACFAAFVTLLEPGDEVVLPSPWYFNHAMSLTSLGVVPVPVATSLAQRHIPAVDAVAAAITPLTRGIVLVNPNNPTGALYDREFLRRLVELAIERDLWIFCDQTYHELHYTPEPPLSPAAIPGAADRVVTVGSFSKTLGLAGWRLGFLGGPGEFVHEMLKIQDSSVISAARIGQEGLLAALPSAGGHVSRVRGVLKGRLDELTAALETEGIETFEKPDGSLFLFLQLPGVKDDLAFCRRILDEQHVVAVPGRAFGPGGEGSIRLSFGSIPGARLAEAVHRMAALL
jgi:aspartate/methionine/tyrosine aminotransferase